MQVIADTNVRVSALINPAWPPPRVLQTLGEGRFDLVASTPLLSELGTVLQRPRLVHRFNVTWIRRWPCCASCASGLSWSM